MLGTPIVHDRHFLWLLPRKPWAQLLDNHGIFTEGPVWFADHECLFWSDIPANRIMRLAADGSVSVFRHDSNHTNGNTRDLQGRLVSCEHSARRVTRTEIDGTITVLADHFGPNASAAWRTACATSPPRRRARIGQAIH
jgi:gluconolactonase